jgi:hypothetical protein
LLKKLKRNEYWSNFTAVAVIVEGNDDVGGGLSAACT